MCGNKRCSAYILKAEQPRKKRGTTCTFKQAKCLFKPCCCYCCYVHFTTKGDARLKINHQSSRLVASVGIYYVYRKEWVLAGQREWMKMIYKKKPGARSVEKGGGAIWICAKRGAVVGTCLDMCSLYGEGKSRMFSWRVTGRRGGL
jgi:hypothetical protein